MLTNTTPVDTQQPTQITATTVAIDDAERRCDAALRDIARLAEAGQVSPVEAADLEAEAVTRFTQHACDLELYGAEVVGPLAWARYEDRAARQRAAAVADRRRNPRLRGLSARDRALRERQMCVVASARVTSDLLRWLSLDDDEETLFIGGAPRQARSHADGGVVGVQTQGTAGRTADMASPTRPRELAREW